MASLALAVAGTIARGPAAENEGSQGPALVTSVPGTRNREEEVPALLRKHCVRCHGAEEAQGGLRLDSRAGALAGGYRGAAIVPGQVEKSLLLGFLTGKNEENLVMPPEGARLSRDEIVSVEAWIATGAHWPMEAVPAAKGAGKRHWAFEPLAAPQVPHIRAEWVRNPIDALVWQKLAEGGLRPNAEASRTELIRRVTFDLTGLPPTAAEVRDFVGDQSPRAYERVVDRLLASPRYGEQMARFWLDLARYADSDGYEDDFDRPWAAHYRDTVIRSFNRDLPYDQFVLEQLAGDELEDVATTEKDRAGEEETAAEMAPAAPGAAEEQRKRLAATGFIFCGPCITNQSNEMLRLDQVDDMTSTTAAVFLGLTLGCARCHDHKTEPFTQRDYYRMAAVFDNTQKSLEENLAVARDPGLQSRITHVLLGGNPQRKGVAVTPGVPAVLDRGTATFPDLPAGQSTVGRRLALARWIADPNNPLTARVWVNRVWQRLFGRGLVDTASNFGPSGSRPTHPQLLDYLAAEFVRGGWRLKSLQRQMVLSNTYRQGSRIVARNAEADPDNRLLWRYGPRRLQGEEIRDAVLAASGSLNETMYGPAVKVRIPPKVISTGATAKWPIVEREGPEHWRRSVYVFSKRSMRLPLFEGFDVPTSAQSCERRQTTTVATQALQLLNGELVAEHSQRLAALVLAQAGDDVAKQVEIAYWRTLSRAPTSAEQNLAMQFLEARTEKRDSTAALEDLCHVLFNLNEFVYLH